MYISKNKEEYGEKFRFDGYNIDFFTVGKDFAIRSAIDFFESISDPCSKLHHMDPEYFLKREKYLEFCYNYLDKRSTTQSRWDARKIKRNIQKYLDKDINNDIVIKTRRKL